MMSSDTLFGAARSIEFFSDEDLRDLRQKGLVLTTVVMARAGPGRAILADLVAFAGHLKARKFVANGPELIESPDAIEGAHVPRIEGE
jgi:hypothetical protein